MILIGNGKLVTRDIKYPYLENGAVLVKNNRIVKIGQTEAMIRNYPDAEYIDAEKMVIMPGFINAHEHIYSAFARGLALSKEPPKNFLEILKKTWWHIDRNMTLNHVYYSALSTYLECIRNGVTFVSDHHASYGAVSGSLFSIAKAAQELSVRTCLAYEISDRDGKVKAQEAIRESMEFLSFVKSKNTTLLKGMIGLHASFTLSDETLSACQTKNVDHAGYHVHIAEGLYDEQHCREHYGMSVVERLYKHGILGDHTLAGHCIHINEEDMNILKKSGTMVVHNPESNMGNAVGAPDVLTMLDKGILVGLGTDGYTNDMLESLKTANLLQKHRRGLPDRGFLEACKLLFENNVQIANKLLDDTIGVLKPGALADIIIVDYKPLTPMNEENIDGHIMFGMQGGMTDSTMVDGKLLMRHRKMLLIDEDEILVRSQEAALDLWSRL